MRYLDEIIVHCTATNPSWMADAPVEDIVKEVTRWHTDPKPHGRGWSDCGYHFIISRNGEIGAARPLERIGAHCKGKNKGTVGVALCGGRGASANDKFEEHFTVEQDKALRTLIANLQKDYPDIDMITGHQDYAAKACPGFIIEEWL